MYAAQKKGVIACTSALLLHTRRTVGFPEDEHRSSSMFLHQLQHLRVDVSVLPLAGVVQYSSLRGMGEVLGESTGRSN